LVEAIVDLNGRAAPHVNSIQELHAMRGSVDAVSTA
jgi:hypothetical protein